MSKRILEYQIVDHGVEHESYFQGCGVSHTCFDDVATGIGNSLREALEDAAESLAQQGYTISDDLEAEISKADDITFGCMLHPCDKGCNDVDQHYYASIRVKGKQGRSNE